MGLTVRGHLVLAYRARHRRARAVEGIVTPASRGSPSGPRPSGWSTSRSPVARRDRRRSRGRAAARDHPAGRGRAGPRDQSVGAPPRRAFGGLDQWEAIKLCRGPAPHGQRRASSRCCSSSTTWRWFSGCRATSSVLDFGELLADRATGDLIRSDPKKVKAAYLGVARAQRRRPLLPGRPDERRQASRTDSGISRRRTPDPTPSRLRRGSGRAPRSSALPGVRTGRNRPAGEDDAVVGHLQGPVNELLDQQHRDTGLADLLQTVEDQVDDQWGEAE